MTKKKTSKLTKATKNIQGHKFSGMHRIFNVSSHSLCVKFEM